MVESHGHSVAAWTGTIVVLVGTALIALGLVFALPILWIGGIVVVAGGALAWVVLEKTGYGEHGNHDKKNQTETARG